MAIKHALVRTSPTGTKFIGTCMNCGRTGLTMKDFVNDTCENLTGRTESESLIEAITPSQQQETPQWLI